MARGWGSNSAEEQAQQNQDRREEAAAAKRQNGVTADQAQRARRRQLLELQRERILSEKTSHAARRNALQAALTEIERELAGLL